MVILKAAISDALELHSAISVPDIFSTLIRRNEIDEVLRNTSAMSSY